MTISSRELAERAGISWAYASQLLSGDLVKRRTPSLAVALKVYDATGLQLGILTGLSEQTINELREKVAA